MTLRQAVSLCGCALILASCTTEAPKQAKEPAKPVEPVTGRFAFYKMFAVARTWAPDVQGLRMNSLRLSSVPDQPAKSGAWEATFVSPSRKKSRSYTYSVAEEGNIHVDTFAGLEENYIQRGQSIPWNIQALKIDTDAAYKTAADKSAEYIKKNPDKPITFVLEQTPRHPNLAWRVVWGTSVGTSNYSIYVDAATGQFLETMR